MGLSHWVRRSVGPDRRDVAGMGGRGVMRVGLLGRARAGRVQICCKGAPRPDRPREEPQNINDSPPALRRDPGLCNRFGQTTPPRAPGGAPRAGRRPRRAPRSAGRARGSVRRGRHRPRCRSRPGAFPVTRREGATMCYDPLRGDGRVHHCASRTARQYRFDSSSCAGGRDLRDHRQRGAGGSALPRGRRAARPSSAARGRHCEDPHRLRPVEARNRRRVPGCAG